MRNKLVGGVAAAIVLIVVGWLIWGGSSEDTKTADKGKASSGSTSGQGPRSKFQGPSDSDADSPRSPTIRHFQRWTMDADPDDGPLRLEGQVVDKDGKPVGGADVWLPGGNPERATATDEDGSFHFDKMVGHTYEISAATGELVGETTYKLTNHSDPVVVRLAEGAGIKVTVTDENKAPIKAHVMVREARKELDTDDQGIATIKPVHPGWIVVEAAAPGYAAGRGFATLGSEGAHGEISIRLRKGFAVSGRVIDEAGKPVAKAHISSEEDFGAGAADEVVTDDQGAFKIAALSHGVHSLLARDGQHAPSTSAPFMVGDKPLDNIEIKMLAGGTMAGTVVDKDGKTVAYATVRVAGDGRARRMTEVGRYTTSDKSGAFELRGLPRAKLSVRAEAADTASKITPVDLEAQAAVKDVKLVLDVSGSIKGVVVDDQGKPVPEVSVHAMPDVLGGGSMEDMMLAGLSTTETDGAGGFEITGLPDGAYKLWAVRSAGQGPFAGGADKGTSAKAGDKNVKLTLPAVGALVAKLAIEGQDAPPRLATVIVGQSVPTPAEGGVVSVKDLAPGSYDVTFRSADFAAFVQHDVEIQPGKTTDLGTVTVPRGRKLVGTVVDSSGTPVSGARVKLGNMLFSSANQEVDDGTFDDAFGLRTSVTDDQGAFTLIGVPVKASTIVADHPDRGRSTGLAVAAGTEDVQGVQLTLKGYGSIVGSVTSQGKPVPDVGISEATQGGGAQASFAKTGTDGTFVMSKVPEGRHVLTAMQQQMMSVKGTSVTVDVVAGKQSTAAIDIPVGTISLAINIKPLPNAKVDAAQVFLFHGTVSFANGKALLDGFFQSGMEGIKFWLGPAFAMPSYDELVAADYTVCGVPITGDLSDTKFQQRLQEEMEHVKVYCKPTKVVAAPDKQSMELDLPSMTPLPPPPSPQQK